MQRLSANLGAGNRARAIPGNDTERIGSGARGDRFTQRVNRGEIHALAVQCYRVSSRRSFHFSASRTKSARTLRFAPRFVEKRARRRFLFIVSLPRGDKFFLDLRRRGEKEREKEKERERERERKREHHTMDIIHRTQLLFDVIFVELREGNSTKKSSSDADYARRGSSNISPA